jgi:hypothetical protein
MEDPVGEEFVEGHGLGFGAGEGDSQLLQRVVLVFFGDVPDVLAFVGGADDVDVVACGSPRQAGVAPLVGNGVVGEEEGLSQGGALGFVDDQRNAKLVLNVVLGGDGSGYDLYRRRVPGGREC